MYASGLATYPCTPLWCASELRTEMIAQSYQGRRLENGPASRCSHACGRPATKCPLPSRIPFFSTGTQSDVQCPPGPAEGEILRLVWSQRVKESRCPSTHCDHLALGQQDNHGQKDEPTGTNSADNARVEQAERISKFR